VLLQLAGFLAGISLRNSVVAMLPTLVWRVEAAAGGLGGVGGGVQKLGWCKLQHSQTNCLSWNIISSLHLPQQQQQQQQKISPCVLKSLVQAEDTAASFATPLCSSSSSGHSSRKKTPTWELFAIAQEGVESMELPPTPAPGNGSVAQPSKDKGDSREGKMLAAVDMGTNSFHMVVVRADKEGQFELVDTAKEDVRLGSGSPDISIITPDAEERALAVIKRFKQLAKMRNADMRIVATSAVREARNRRMFVRRMLEVAGVEIEVLSGQEEACLIYQGVLQALPVYDKTVLVVDIGGGSTEFVLGKAGKPLYATSLKLGHIRLSEQFLGLGRSREELKKEQVMDTWQFHQ
jgi:Ethanolamine utilization protein EutJ (predicted chaperonin)